MEIRYVLLVAALAAIIDLNCAAPNANGTEATTTANKKPRCSDCENCSKERTPICAVEHGTENFKGFRSLCYMECSNNCNEKQFDFLGEGKCGRYRPQFVPVEMSDELPQDRDQKKKNRKQLQKTKYQIDVD